ncbi:MAG: tRNA (N(6)-L-threonylcarbamoyladenosine(37)-C(2))-methylthiotransferase MtaB, partial [Pseudoflavonifractor sp.]
TCTVTAGGDKKCRIAIRQARKRAPQAVVAVCGCYAQTAPEVIAALGADLISGTADRMGFLDRLEDLAGQEKRTVPLSLVDDAMARRTFEQLPARRGAPAPC